MSDHHRNARLYHTVRTAHLERAAELPPADILYGVRRYDFHEAAAQHVSVEQLSDFRTALAVAQRGYAALEINEPIALETVRRSALSLVAVGLMDLLHARHTLVTTYAIGNMDPREIPQPGTWKARLGRKLDEWLMPRVWKRCDRIAFGTKAAQSIYDDVLGAPRADAGVAVIPALPVACGRCEDRLDKKRGLLFLGDLSARKGFDLLLSAWPQIRAALPNAELTIVGRGQFTQQAQELAARDDRVQFEEDPARAVIHEALSRAEVLTLPSQPTQRWKEQVGLPIVEGLAHGCTIVTTTSTGLSEWLSEHGHTVLPTPTSVDVLARAVINRMTAEPEPHTVVGSLPSLDGRLAADHWMFA